MSFTPGVELVLEAFDGYWRKTPNVKRLVMKVIPDESTRLAALKGGEVDIAYSIRGELAEELQRTPGLSIKSVVLQAPNWIYFPEQWDPKSPWHKLRVRQAANLALDRDGMNKALFLGRCKINNSIIPSSFEYLLAAAARRITIRRKAKKLLAEAGYPERVRRRAVLVRQLLRQYRRGRRSNPAAGRHPHQAAADRARRVRSRLRRQEIRQGHIARGERRVRQRRDAARPRSSSRAARTSTAAIPTSTSFTRSRPTNSTRRSARRSCTRCSSSCTKRRSTRRSGSLPSQRRRTAGRRGAFGRIAGFPYTAPFEDLTIRRDSRVGGPGRILVGGRSAEPRFSLAAPAPNRAAAAGSGKSGIGRPRSGLSQTLA